MWEIEFAAQIISFLRSLLLGGIYGLAYDLFHAPFRKRGAVTFFVCDILYFVVIAFVNFCFLLAVSNGKVRGYLLVGAAIGFIIYKKTLSPVLAAVAAFVLRPIKALFSLIARGFSAVSEGLSAFFSKNAEKISQNIKKILKKG